MNPYLYWTGNVQVIFHGDPKYNYATCVLSTSPVLSTKVESPNDISSSDEDSKHGSESGYYDLSETKKSETANEQSFSRIKLVTPAKHVPKEPAKTIYKPRENEILFQKNDDIFGKIGYSEQNFSERKGVKSGCGKTTIDTGVFRSKPLSKKNSINKKSFGRKKKKFPSPKKKDTKITPKVKHRQEKTQKIRYLDLPQIGWFNLNYCSTPGLIYADILPKPKDWVWAEARCRYKYLDDKKTETIKFDEIIVTGVQETPGSKIIHEVPCLDLTRYLD